MVCSRHLFNIGVIALALGWGNSPAIAQGIIPASDELSTQVQVQDNVSMIRGGQTSADGASLFHSFSEFNLNSGETAQFLTPANTQSVLGRIVGGNPSYIDGTLQLVGSQADLYLLNPAGLVFGQNATLDVPGVFLGSTATGIGFEDASGAAQWFDVFAPAVPQSFGGGPSLLRFEVETPGSIANFGNLEVAAGEQIWLVGGNVLQGGSLTAPAGTIAITAVEGNQQARFAPVVPFSLFGVPIGTSLRQVTPPAPPTAPAPFSPLDLPALLTGAEGLYSANQVTVTDQGQVLLQGGALPATAVNPNSGTATLNGTIDISNGDASSFRFGTAIATGEEVNVVGSTFDSRGAFTAGFVSFGGSTDRQGPGGLPTTRITIDAATTINASTLVQGNGGIVAVRSTAPSSFAGQLTAQGGPLGGDGGFLAFDDVPAPTAVIDLSAPNGRPGGIVTSDSATADSLNATLRELLISFETVSQFTEFDPLFTGALDTVDIRDPAAVNALIANQDLSASSLGFTEATAQVTDTLSRFEGVLAEAFDFVNAFLARGNLRGSANVESLLAVGGTVLSAPVNVNASSARQSLSDRLDELTAAELVGSMEQLRAAEYGNHWGVTYQVPVVESSVGSIQTVLQAIAQNPGQPAAVVYALINGEDLELTLVLPSGPPKRHTVRNVASSLFSANRQLRQSITSPIRESQIYRAPAQTLYQALLAPFRAMLDNGEIELLLFSLDPGLRSLPIAALHDGKQFLVENYAVAIIPSFGLLETDYTPLTNAQVLVAGASRFNDFGDLPAVPVELAAIQENWQTVDLMESEFTLDAMQTIRQESEFAIAHLATHAVFQDGHPSNSFVQLWGDERLGLDAIASLNFHQPPLELLVLSACRTAFGNESAELGFAGLSVQSGAKSVVASLWQVSDTGTLALMSEFYDQLGTIATKAEALRQAQLAMLRNETTAVKDFLSSGNRGGFSFSIPPELTAPTDFSHPYFWSGFTLVGSPW